MKKSWLWAEMIAWVLFLFIVIALTVGCNPKVDPVENDYITVEVYWASYCPYCIEELKVINEIAYEIVGHPYLGGKVEIVTYNLDLTPEELQTFIYDWEHETWLVTTKTGYALPKWSNEIPTIVIRDTFEKIVFKHVGTMDKAYLYSVIMETLGFTARI